MDWIKVKIITSKEGIEPVSAVLSDLGISGIEISDKDDFKEFLENNRKYWDYVDEELERLKDADTVITLYLSDDEEGESTLSEIKSALSALKGAELDLGSLEVSTEKVKDEDWSENWKQYFKPLEIGEKILVCPQWEKIPQTDRKVFLINPGMSFGTGSHESTRMCIEELEKAVTLGCTVTDLGCGSGILSVISLILGASKVRAVDIDPAAVEVSYSNLALNGFEKEKLEGFAGDVTCDEELFEYLSANKAEIVVANIVADVIIALSKFAKAFMKEGGKFICSGIIKERTDEVAHALENAGFNIKSVRTQGEWSLVVATSSWQQVFNSISHDV